MRIPALAPVLLGATLAATAGCGTANNGGAAQPSPSSAMMEHSPSPATMMEHSPSPGAMMEHSPSPGAMMEHSPSPTP